MIQTKETRVDNEIYGQYAMDNAGTAEGEVFDSTGTLDLRGSGPADFHQRGLWDEENTTVPDEATGNVDKIPSDHEALGLEVQETLGATSLDAAMGMSDDEAARWLAEHDKE